MSAIVREQRGSTIAMMAVGLIPTVAALGSAIDMGRVYVTKSQLQAGVDAGALAGARAYEIEDASPQGREAQIDAYFYGNFVQGYMGSSNLRLTKRFAVISNRNTTTVTATADVPMTFMRIFGFNTRQVVATARAEIQPHPLELMMVLDNTGSLATLLPADASGNQVTRITALKTSANSFFDILYQGAENREDLAIGMITYAVTVNVGNLLTNWRASSVQQQFGFNDSYMYSYLGRWPSNKLAWKGCVMADQTIKNMSTDLNVQDAGAWDIDRTLPGEGLHPAVQPWFVPPYWLPKTVSTKTQSEAQMRADSAGAYYQFANSDAGYNLYQLDPTYYDYMLNPVQNGIPAVSQYRRYFYQYYIGLNAASSVKTDDVITTPGGDYYDPATMSWDFKTNTGTPFKINYNRIPRFGDWKPATTAEVNPLGGSDKDFWKNNRTDPPSPNWTCPDEAVPVAYNRAKQFYKDQIRDHNGAIYPASGTIHHAGMLWGFRMLVRDDKFTRTPPSRAEAPKRALVFMTDGETNVPAGSAGAPDRGFTFYGLYSDSPLTNTPDGMKDATELRFAKTCAALKREASPPKVYIIALTTTDAKTLAAFEQCAPGHVYRTSDAATLKAAFDDVASELIDLHLVK